MLTKTQNHLTVFLIGLALVMGSSPLEAADDIAGGWRTPAGTLIEIGDCGGTYCGRITEFTPPPGLTVEATVDANNRDETKRSRKILGLAVLWDLKPGKDDWRGRAYDPRRGMSANAIVKRAGPDRLTVKGCLRVVVNLCETETLTRAK